MAVWRLPALYGTTLFAGANGSNTSRSRYNSLEGLVSIVAGAIAGSVSLIGFGLDSIIEVTSGAALLWRLHHDLNPIPA